MADKKTNTPFSMNLDEGKSSMTYREAQALAKRIYKQSNPKRKKRKKSDFKINY